MPVLDVSWRVPRSALYEHGGAIAGRMRIPPDGGQEGRQGAACRTDGGCGTNAYSHGLGERGWEARVWRDAVKGPG
ncbi:hypothethical protein (plasmid) [Ralstonia solanacearum PSI07]|nr:hypothethical protein [Ralstonia solanacearum PSI07]